MCVCVYARYNSFYQLPLTEETENEQNEIRRDTERENTNSFINSTELSPEFSRSRSQEAHECFLLNYYRLKFRLVLKLILIKCNMWFTFASLNKHIVRYSMFGFGEVLQCSKVRMRKVCSSRNGLRIGPHFVDFRTFTDTHTRTHLASLVTPNCFHDVVTVLCVYIISLHQHHCYYYYCCAATLPGRLCFDVVQLCIHTSAPPIDIRRLNSSTKLNKRTATENPFTHTTTSTGKKNIHYSSRARMMVMF